MKPKASLRSFLLLAGSSLLACSQTHAASGDWNYDGATAANLLWSSATSWTPNSSSVGTVADDVVTFTNDITAARTITIATATTQTVGSLTIGDFDNSHGFTIADGGTGVLAFDVTSGDAQLVENGSVNDTFTTAVTLNDNLDITANGSLTFSAGNGFFTAGSNTITKLGAGSLIFTNNNGASLTNAATFDVQAGTLSWGNAGAFGGATINLNGGNLDSTSNQNGQNPGNTQNWNQNWTWGGSAAIFGFSGGVTLGASTVQVTVSQNQLNVNGIINDTGAGRGLTKAGPGTLVLANANSFSGATTVTGGVLRLGNDTSLAGGIGASGGNSALTLNGGVVEMASSDFSRDLGTAASQFQITGGTSGFSSFAGKHSVTINNNAGQEVQWGSTHFSPTELVLNASTANAALDFRNGIDLNGADRTINVNANTAELSNVIRTSTGTAGLIKGGAGTLVLSGANTYNGTTAVNAGVLSIVSTAHLPGYNAPENVVFNGGTVRVAVGGSGWTTGQVDTLLSNATKTGGAIGIDTSSGNLTQWTAFTGNLGALGLEKSGSNTLTLDQVNSYTGATTIRGGTLQLSMGAQSLSGGLSIAGPDVTVLSDNSTTATFGTLTRAAGSSINLTTSGGGSLTLGNSAGFLNVGAFYNGADFAWIDSTTPGLVRAPIYDGTGGTSLANDLTASTHALLSSDLSFNPGGNRSLSSLKVTGGADLTFTASHRLLTNAIVVSGGDSVINLGTAQLGLNGGTELVIRVDGSSDQLTAPGLINVVNFVKSGAGKLVLATNTSGTASNVYVNGGTLEVQAALAHPNVEIASDATLIYNIGSAQSFGSNLSNGTISGGGNLVKNGTATFTISSPTSFTGTTTISGGVLQLGSAYALSGSTLDTANSVAGAASVGLRISAGITNLTVGGLSGNKDFASGGVFSTSSNNYGNISVLTLNSRAGISNDYSGAIGDGASGMTLNKIGQGTQALSGANTYTGPTSVSAGKLFVNGDSSAASGAVSVSADATLGGTGTIGGDTTIAAVGKLEFNLSTAPGSHDKLELAAGKTLTFSGTSKLTITSSGSPGTGLFTLLTVPGGISGSVPATVILPAGWTANPPEITGVGNTDLVINITSTDGGGSPYSTWASTNAPSGDPDDDFDGDGVSNAVEFVLGGDKDTNDLGKLPVAAASGTDMTFTFTRDETSVDDGVAVTIETSNDLVTWDAGSSPYTVPGADTGGVVNPGVTVVDNGSTHTVTLTIPKAPDTKKFARLKVIITP